MNWKYINAGLVWAAITTTVTAIFWLQDSFASKQEVEDIKLQIAYSARYDRFDDYEEALDEGREALAEEYKRQMEKLRAYICEHDPEWERCKD